MDLILLAGVLCVGAWFFGDREHRNTILIGRLGVVLLFAFLVSIVLVVAVPIRWQAVWLVSVSVLLAVPLYQVRHRIREKVQPLLDRWQVERRAEKFRKAVVDAFQDRHVPAPEIRDARDLELSAKAARRFEELRPDQKIRGVWEAVFTRTRGTGSVFEGDQLAAVEAGVIVGPRGPFLAVRREDKRTWLEAVSDPLSDTAKLVAAIDLPNINSIELARGGEYHGSGSTQGYGIPKPNKTAYDRHPYIASNKAGGWFLDDNSVHIVFAFERDGTRTPIFKTYDYDAAIKGRARLANIVQEAAHQDASSSAARDETADYL